MSAPPFQVIDNIEQEGLTVCIYTNGNTQGHCFRIGALVGADLVERVKHAPELFDALCSCLPIIQDYRRLRLGNGAQTTTTTQDADRCIEKIMAAIARVLA